MRYSLALAALLAGCSTAPATSLPDGKNRVVDIVNTADMPLHFSARNAERRGLMRPPPIEADVAAQYYLTLNLDDASGACLFDFSAVYPDGRSVQTAQFNTCTEVSWVVTP